MGRQDHRREGAQLGVQMARAEGNPFVHFGHRGGHASGGGEHPTSEGRGNGRWTALGESVHAIQVTDGRLEARSDRLVGRARGAEIDGDTCCEPRATARGRGGRRRGTLAPDPSGRRRRLDGRSERAAQARSRGRPRSHASSRDDVGRPWRGPYESRRNRTGCRPGSERIRRCRSALYEAMPRSSRPCGSTSPDYGRTTWRAVALPFAKMVQGGMELERAAVLSGLTAKHTASPACDGKSVARPALLHLPSPRRGRSRDGPRPGQQAHQRRIPSG